MDNMEGKAPPKKKVVKSRAKPKPTATVNMLSSQDEPKKRVVKSRAKPKPTQPTETINILSEAPTPQEEPKKRVVKSRAKPKPQQTEAVNILSEEEEPKKRVVKSRAKPKPTQPTEAVNILSEAPKPKRTPKPKTSVNVPEGEFIEKAKLKQLKDAERIYSKAIKSLTK